MLPWPNATDKASVLARIECSWASLDEVVGGLIDEQLGSSGPDGWTVKDHLAHIAGWNLSLVALLDGSRVMVLRALAELTDADLRRPYRDYQPHDLRTGPLTSDDPVVRYIIGSIEDHVAEHLCCIGSLLSQVGPEGEPSLVPTASSTTDKTVVHLTAFSPSNAAG